MTIVDVVTTHYTLRPSCRVLERREIARRTSHRMLRRARYTVISETHACLYTSIRLVSVRARSCDDDIAIISERASETYLRGALLVVLQRVNDCALRVRS